MRGESPISLGSPSPGAAPDSAAESSVSKRAIDRPGGVIGDYARTMELIAENDILRRENQLLRERIDRLVDEIHSLKDGRHETHRIVPKQQMFRVDL